MPTLLFHTGKHYSNWGGAGEGEKGRSLKERGYEISWKENASCVVDPGAGKRILKGIVWTLPGGAQIKG